MADSCLLLPPPLFAACEAGKRVAPQLPQIPVVGPTLSFAADPVGFIAKAVATSTVWLWEQLGTAVTTVTAVDFTNPGFLQTYALVFALSSVLVVLLWLVAVAKRAVRGAPIGRAFGESIGLLGVAVGVSAFAPAALVLLVGLSDAAATGLAAGIGVDATRTMTGASTAMTALAAGNFVGGAGLVLLLALIGMVVAALLLLELLIAAAGLYVAGVFGPLVFAGLVDRSMWSHSKKWLGVVVALALARPVILTVLGLAAGLSATGVPGDGFASVLQALAMLLLAVFASYAVYRFVPVVGDQLGQLHNDRKQMAAAGPAAAVPGPASVMASSITYHTRGLGRGGGGGGSRGGGAHSTRPSSTGRPAGGQQPGAGPHADRGSRPSPAPPQGRQLAPGLEPRQPAPAAPTPSSRGTRS